MVRLWVIAALCAVLPATAQQTVRARVKLEIKQELTLERQAFDAEMRITNTLADGVISEVKVDVKLTDELGVPIRITSDPNDTSGAHFFVRISNRQNIDNVEGTGAVSPNSTATINWRLRISAPLDAAI